MDWQELQNLRSKYLKSLGSTTPDYWSAELLASYDCTFGARIGWKWDSVVVDICEKFSLPENMSVLDWGCGSGVASRALLKNFAGNIKEVYHWDRSLEAVEYSIKKAEEKFPDTKHSRWNGSKPAGPLMVLISHVMTELDERDFGELVSLIRDYADLLIWVEPGTKEVGQKLGQVHDKLLETFLVLGPCTHQLKCPLAGSDVEQKDWCHFFADCPSHVFQSAHWQQFKDELGVDLRSLPVSYLSLAKPCFVEKKVSDEGINRILGRVRAYKGHCKMLACGPHGVSEHVIQKRDDKKEFKRLCRGGFADRYLPNHL